MQTWWQLTAFGDSTVILPLSGVLLVVLLLAWRAQGRLGWLWLLAVLVDGCLIIASKVLYMGWGLHPPGLDFTGLSGHSAMAFLFWPVLGTLAAGQLGAGRWLGTALGVLLAVGVAGSRLALQVHSPSEVLLGSLWGALVAAAFLLVAHRRLKVPHRYSWLLVLLLIPPLLLARQFNFPSNRILAYTAQQLSGHRVIFTRNDLGRRNVDMR